MNPSISHDRRAAVASDSTWWWVFRSGVCAGFFAGMSFLAYSMMTDWLLKDQPLFTLRSIAAILLGRDALAAWYSAFAAVLIGFGIHLLLSILFGLFFAWLTARCGLRSASPPGLAAWGLLYGTGLWLINYYLIAPLPGWYWFARQTQWLVQGLIGHAAFFGAVLGWMMSREVNN